jgi:hypothetical protein
VTTLSPRSASSLGSKDKAARGSVTRTRRKGVTLVMSQGGHPLGAVEDSALLLTVALILGSPGTVGATSAGRPLLGHEEWEGSIRRPAPRTPRSRSGSP